VVSDLCVCDHQSSWRHSQWSHAVGADLNIGATNPPAGDSALWMACNTTDGTIHTRPTGYGPFGQFYRYARDGHTPTREIIDHLSNGTLNLRSLVLHNYRSSRGYLIYLWN
jgi:hypothetical protein